MTLSTLCLFLLALLTLSTLLAQPAYTPPHLKTEAFAGFATAYLTPGRLNNQSLDRLRLNGYAVGLTSFEWFERWGLTAEFAQRTGSREGIAADTNTMLFGGAYRALTRRRFSLTGRIVAGAEQWRPTQSGNGLYRSQTSFAFGFGQSIDLKFNENVALRLRPELLLVRRERLDGTRGLELVNPFSVGLVLKFGRR